jgi:hypothetical protein
MIEILIAVVQEQRRARLLTREATRAVDPVTVELADPYHTVAALLAEHDSLRRTIDGIWNREAQLIVALVLATAASIPIIVQLNDINRAAVLFPASLLFAVLAGSIQLQYWVILWHQGYIKQRLRPRLLRALQLPAQDRAILGFEEFQREWKDKHWGLMVTVGIGAMLQTGLVILPSVIFLSLGYWYHFVKGATWLFSDFTTGSLASLAVVLLLFATLLGYRTNAVAFEQSPSI